ncbi:hypothetical protein D3C85_1382250 [compost metagenome]
MLLAGDKRDSVGIELSKLFKPFAAIVLGSEFFATLPFIPYAALNFKDLIQLISWIKFSLLIFHAAPTDHKGLYLYFGSVPNRLD